MGKIASAIVDDTLAAGSLVPAGACHSRRMVQIAAGVVGGLIGGALLGGALDSRRAPPPPFYTHR